MSQIIEYFRSLFNTNNNHNRKRRRVDLFPEDREPLPKYKKVTNIFPKTYTALLDDDTDYFQEVKQNKPLYNELLENFLMDRQRTHLKAVLDDGEFSDEEEDAFRMPASSFSKRNPSGYNFQTYRQGIDSQPSTSANAFQSSRIARLQHLTNGNSSRSKDLPISRNNHDDDVQFVSLSRKPMTQKTTRQELPSLIPISRTIYSSSMISNGHSSSDLSTSRPTPIATVPVRGRRSILDFAKKNRAFNEPSPRVPNLNSILYHERSNSRYNELLKSLIPSYSNAASLKQSKVSVNKPIETIDLSDDTENIPANNIEVPQQSSTTSFLNTSFTERKSDFHFKKPSAYVDLDDEDDDVNQTRFARSPGLSSTQIIKSNDIDRSLAITDDKKKQLLYRDLPPMNSLKEKHSTRTSLQDDHLEKLLGRYIQNKAEKNKTIEEEEKNISRLEKERIQYERVQQKRIDEQITSALTDKCIIIDEEEEVVDEFPPLTAEQNRLVQFALHGPKNDIIISKFNMNITRHDFATLDGLNWLNDEVINFYMELIKERSERLTHLPKVHVMNTFFLGKLLQSGHSGVRRWTRKVDIFSFDIIPIPVHVGGVHWCMSVINMRDKTIRYYDSMGHPNHVVLEALEQYLKDESMDKRKIPFDTSDWIFECVVDCPQQKNGSDCGVFSCQFAEFISRDSPISFEQQHMPYIRRKMIYEIASGKLLLGG